MSEKVKVLVVDDAAFMRKAVSDILEKDENIRVIGSAKNGIDCLDKVPKLQPDVITLDMDMPVMDGLTSLRHLMIKSPVPVVVLSSLFTDGVITFDALRLGVVDFVPKPSGAISKDIQNARRQIIERTKIAQSVNLGNIRRVRIPRWNMHDHIIDRYSYRPLEYLIAVGTNLSGPNTIIRFIANLPPSLPAAVVVVQEISPQIISSFVKRFDQLMQWKVIEAKDNMIIEQGVCYISSNQHALTFETNSKGETCLRVGSVSAYPLNTFFSSAAEVYQQNTIGILLTGIGDDGAEGFRQIQENSGVTIAQETKCCVYPNLTENAIEKNVVDIILDEKKLPEAVGMVMHQMELK